MQFGIHFGKAKGHSKAMVNFTKIVFVTIKRFIPKQFFSLNMNFSESINGFRTASKNCSKTYAAPCRRLTTSCFFDGKQHPKNIWLHQC